MIAYAIRHGITPLNKQKKVNAEVDESLAPEGIEQARAAVSQVPGNVTTIYTSPLLRAKQTADILGSGLRLPVIVADELAEIRMGSLAGKSWEEMEGGAELKKRHRSVQFDYRPYGGESLEEVKMRILSFFGKISDKHSDREVLLVTHGGIIRVFTMLERGELVDETAEHGSLLAFDADKILTMPRS